MALTVSVNRKAVICIVIAMILAITGLAFVFRDPGPIGPMAIVELRVTDVQFDEDYLNITVKNVGTIPTIISEVIVNQTSTPHIVQVHEPISTNEEITIRIWFMWTSGYTYQIELKTTDNADWNNPATSVAVAP
jgi:hypothetical protein